MATSYKISRVAEKDWEDIVRYTLENFGRRQVQKYTDNLIACLEDMSSGVGGLYKKIDISGYPVLIKHCKHHYIFALAMPEKPLLIIAIFHERMDLMKRLKDRLP